MVWSDIPNNRQLRWLADDGRVTVFRTPSGYSNGNTFDFEGRQISCEHGGRRVVRYEHSGEETVIADSFEGKRLNSPNDAVVHPDGGVWFTDPPYGIRGNCEGFRSDSELPLQVYRVDPSTGRIAVVTDEIGAPNGICFSPDYERLYVADTGAVREIKVWDVEGTGLRNGRRFRQLTIPGTDGTLSFADGMRWDVDGNVWAGARPGVQVIAPDGELIGMIRLPENCANVCFGGPRRNRLFMTAKPVALRGRRGNPGRRRRLKAPSNQRRARRASRARRGAFGAPAERPRGFGAQPRPINSRPGPSRPG